MNISEYEVNIYSPQSESNGFICLFHIKANQKFYMQNEFELEVNFCYKWIFEIQCSEYFVKKEPNIAKLNVSFPLLTAQSLLLLPTAHYTLLIAYCPLPVVHFFPLPTVYCPQSTAHCPLSTVHCPLSTVHCPLPSPTVLCPLTTAQWPLSTVHCPLSTVHAVCISTASWFHWF
jgi:hypothetical protein